MPFLSYLGTLSRNVISTEGDPLWERRLSMIILWLSGLLDWSVMLSSSSVSKGLSGKLNMHNFYVSCTTDSWFHRNTTAILHLYCNHFAIKLLTLLKMTSDKFSINFMTIVLQCLYCAFFFFSAESLRLKTGKVTKWTQISISRLHIYLVSRCAINWIM